MISLLKRLIFHNWQRKLVSLILSVIIWMVVHHSMTSTKTIPGVPVRITHLPEGKTIEGMMSNGTLSQKINLNISGNRTSLEEITNKNVEIVIDASGQPDQWIANITKNNLVCAHPEVDLSKSIFRVVPQEIIIKQTKLVTEKIPVSITNPIGEAPKGYQFLDIWPYHLNLTIHGPEEMVKKLKSKGLQLTFNLSDISDHELEALQKGPHQEEVSFYVPDHWKKVSIPELSETPFEIDDPLAKSLKVDFSKQDLLPLPSPLPITVFFSPKYSQTLNPETYTLAVNDFVIKKQGIKMIGQPLYAYGVSRQFLDIVKDMLQLVVIAQPKSERETLLWNLQLLDPAALEDRYVAKILSESPADMREEILRSRFRSYMNHLSLYTQKRKKLALKIELQANAISVSHVSE